MIFVDTNYFLRFLLKDVDNQYLQVKTLMSQAAGGKLKLFTSLVVFFEIYWVLASYYGKDKFHLIGTLDSLLNLGFIELTERDLLRDSLKLFSQSTLSLEDCYNLVFAKAKKADAFKTFDAKLAKTFREKV